VTQVTEEKIGFVEHYFDKIGVAAIKLTGSLKVGDKIHIKGHTTDIEMVLESMQIDNVNVKEANKGKSVGIKVPERVRPGDMIYVVT
jgi:translation initiation factor IF-2